MFSATVDWPREGDRSMFSATVDWQKSFFR